MSGQQQQTVTLTLSTTAEGVLVHSDVDSASSDPAARVAVTLLRFCDGLFEASQPVQLAPRLAQQVWGAAR